MDLRPVQLDALGLHVQGDVVSASTTVRDEILDLAEQHGWHALHGAGGTQHVDLIRGGRLIEVQFDVCGRVWSIVERGDGLRFEPLVDSDLLRELLLDMLRAPATACRHASTYNAVSHCPDCRARRENYERIGAAS